VRDRSEIRFERQRRIGIFGAIRSASLLRKSILENGQRATTAAGSCSPIQVICHCSNFLNIVLIQYLIHIALQQYSTLSQAAMPLNGAQA
jgi:hypothetical protein